MVNPKQRIVCSSLRAAVFSFPRVGCLLILSLLLTGCPGEGIYKPVGQAPEMDLNAKPMDEASFWKILEQANTDRPASDEKFRGKLVEILQQKSESELKGFKLQYVEQFNRLMRADVQSMFAVVALVDDDEESFFHYRDGLIAMGRDRVQAVLDDPQEILKDVDGTTIDVIDYGFYMAADTAWQEKSGDAEAAIWVPLNLTTEATGEPLKIDDESKVEKDFPKLYEFIQRRNRIEEKELFGGR